MSDVGAIARLVRVDARRTPEFWRTRLRSLAMVVGFVGLLAVLANVGDQRENETRRSVAVTDESTVAFATPGLTLDVVDDPGQAVADGDADLAVTVDASGRLVVAFDPDDEDSADARTRLLVAIADADRRPVIPVELRTLDPERGVRDRSIATTVLFGLAFGAQAIISAATGSTGSATGERVLEPVLVLPIRRPRLALGFALGHAPGILLHQIAIGATVLALAAVPVPGLGLAVGDLPSAAAGMAIAVLGLTLVAVGVASFLTIGLAGRQRRALGSAVVLPFVFAGFIAANRVAAPPDVFGWLPVLSNLGVAADGILGRIDVAAAARSLVVAAATCAALLRATARFTGRESTISR